MIIDIDEIIGLALNEDVGEGDITSLACIQKDATGTAVLTAKEKGILAGVAMAKRVFLKVDPALEFNAFIADGAEVNPGDKIFEVTGNCIAILSAERLALNILQRMSGIATATREMVQKIQHTSAKILDTRKTTPNFRIFEKMAVRIGGGVNHRFGLFDMFLIKDNHVDFAGGIENALNAVQNYIEKTGNTFPVIIEVRNMDELEKVLAIGKVDRIMFDNFTPELMKKAVDLVNKQYITEASGGVTIQNIKDYAETGVDFISVGALTHHIQSLDLSLTKI